MFSFFFGGVFSGGVKEKTAVNGAFLLFRVSPLLSSSGGSFFFLFGLGGNKVILEMPRVWGGSHCFVKGGHTALSSTDRKSVV